MVVATPRLTREREECIMSLLKLGLSYREIAEKCGVDKNTVMRRARKLESASSRRGEAGQATQATVCEQVYEQPRSGRGEHISSQDVAFIMGAVKSRVDPRAPIQTKWVEDLSWWQHVILDTSMYLLPELMSMLSSDEVDLENPEATARAMVSKFKSIKQLAEERAKVVSEYEARIRELEAKVAGYRELVEKYRKALEEAVGYLEDFKSKASRTINFLVVYVPQAFSGYERAKYLSMVIPHLREVWGLKLDGEKPREASRDA